MLALEGMRLAHGVKKGGTLPHDPDDDGTKELKGLVLAHRKWASRYPTQWIRWEGVVWQGEIEV